MWKISSWIKPSQHSDAHKIRALEKLYAALDKEIARFQKATGLQCLSGCGRCCENPQVETTVLELLPLATELWKSKEAEPAIAKALQANLSGPCIFYKPDPLIAGKGRCAVYPWRPLICRLFGFSATTDKYGKPTLVTCSAIKQTYAQEYIFAEARIKSGRPVPSMGDFSRRAFHIDPNLGKDQLPINEAIVKALEKVGIRLKYAGR